MKKRYLIAGVLGLGLIAGYFMWDRSVRKVAVLQGLELAQDDPVCLFVGEFSNSGVPIARMVGDFKSHVRPMSDFNDRFMHEEIAKPFHFGIVIVRGKTGDQFQGEAWGWSYRNHAYWQDDGMGVFKLAYSGDALADCEASYQRGSEDNS